MERPGSERATAHSATVATAPGARATSKLQKESHFKMCISVKTPAPRKKSSGSKEGMQKGYPKASVPFPPHLRSLGSVRTIHSEFMHPTPGC